MSFDSRSVPGLFTHGGRRDLRFEFRDGGEATMVAAESYSETTVFPSNCAPVACENMTYFADFSPFASSSSDSDLDGDSCTSAGCDTCRCTTIVSNDESGPTEWKYSGALLHIGSGVSGQFNYCVADKTLTLTKGSTVYDFEAVDVVGVPLACAERSPGQCGIGDGCATGGCIGASVDCDGATEEDCTIAPACEWDLSACVGEVPLDCTLADADVVPGCDFEPL